ncbi:MAG: hypothetical protein SVX38_11165, partial [Chloroflexota bacterium]|nr:hypothetical protein [Chloroflexota bacterium]
MDIKLGTEVGRLFVVNGVRRERAACLGTFGQPTSLFRRRDRGRLFVAVELTGDELGRDVLYEDLVNLVGNTYYEATGSVTAGLRSALHAVNARLLRENRGLSRGEGRLAGVSCAVLRGEGLYVAQAGPALVHIVRRGQVLTFPDSPSPLDWLAEGPGAPLGRQRVADVRFFHHTVQPGDVILLTQPTWARQIDPRQIAEAVVSVGVDQAIGNLQALAGQEHAAALIVEIAREGEKGDTPRARLRTETAPRRPRRERTRPAEVELQEVPAAAEPAVAPVATARASGLNLSSWLRSAGRGLLAVLAVMLDGLRRLLVRILPGRGEAAPQSARPAQARGARSGTGSPLVVWMAAAIPIIVVLLVVGMYWRQGSNRQAEFAELLAQARDEYDQARINEEDVPVAREHYRQALSLAGSALAMRENDPTAQEIQRQAQDALDRIDNVYRLYDLTPLYTYTESGSAPGELISDGQNIFVLDRGTGQVYHHVFNELGSDLQETTVIVQKGQAVDGAATGDLIDMVWRPDGGDHHRGSLFILDGNGRLLEYDPIFSTVVALPLGGLDQWRSPQAVSTYFDQTKTNFYILDTGLNQILKYVPTENLYEDAPTGYVTAEDLDLSGAVDMAINGYVYLLYGDGRVQKLYTGQIEDFALNGLADPLNSPSAIFTANHDNAVEYL